jgi:hypothetical protein
MQENRLLPRRCFKIVNDLSNLIENPIIKLKFLNEVLGIQPHRGRLIWSLPFFRTLCFRIAVVRRIKPFLPGGKKELAALLKNKNTSFTNILFLRSHPHWQSFIFLGPLVILGALLPIFYYLLPSHAHLSFKKDPGLIPASHECVKSSDREMVDTVNQEPMTIEQEDTLSSEDIETTPGRIWLVEKEGTYELYSNGLMITTEHQTKSVRRHCYVYDTDREDWVEPKNGLFSPVGILYHASESDIVPLKEFLNNSILKNTRNLLSYVRRNKAYHYVIDRYGRVYRIVDDREVANHAGKSVWVNDNEVYLNLNQHFIGICFEGRTFLKTGINNTNIINELQIESAKKLTDLLRFLYDIPDMNCTTHGLVSVNPSAMLIGHHMCLASGFPFNKLGLKDKYEVIHPAIRYFGFTFDEFFVSQIGNTPWPGIVKAQQELEAIASARCIAVQQLLEELRADYRAKIGWLLAQHPAYIGG